MSQPQYAPQGQPQYAPQPNYGAPPPQGYAPQQYPPQQQQQGYPPQQQPYQPQPYYQPQPQYAPQPGYQQQQQQVVYAQQPGVTYIQPVPQQYMQQQAVVMSPNAASMMQAPNAAMAVGQFGAATLAMAAPPAPVGTPPGLEYFSVLDHIWVKEMPQALEQFTSVELNQKYQCLNNQGLQVYWAQVSLTSITPSHHTCTLLCPFELLAYHRLSRLHAFSCTVLWCRRTRTAALVSVVVPVARSTFTFTTQLESR